MKVFKFGGASTNSTERIHLVGDILYDYREQPMLAVISAMGKTTNALEKVVECFFEGRSQEGFALLEQIKEKHLNSAKYLLVKNYLETEKVMRDFFTEAEWLLQERPEKSFDYYYDQVVCVGELLSSRLLSAWLNERGIENTWIDVRDVIRTDDNFRDAAIDWEVTFQKVQAQVIPLWDKYPLVITQGFIGATDENESTTLGREGSDYSAAVFANLLNAEDLTIWKDVPGVMNADPKTFADATTIENLNYDEVIEMAYYGAQVIHPKTIKPLENKSIPLRVRCFLDKMLPGTHIHNGQVRGLPPIIVWKANQVLMHLHSRDFSFVGEKPTAELYHLFAVNKMKPNLIQSGAVTLLVCLDDHKEKIDRFAAAAAAIFDIHLEKGLTLLTVRHYNKEILSELTEGKKLVLQQQSSETVQILMR